MHRSQGLARFQVYLRSSSFCLWIANIRALFFCCTDKESGLLSHHAESESILLDADLIMEGLPILQVWDCVSEIVAPRVNVGRNHVRQHDQNHSSGKELSFDVVHVPSEGFELISFSFFRLRAARL